MRRSRFDLLVIGGALWLYSHLATAAQPGDASSHSPLAQIHFRGFNHLATAAEGATLARIAKLSETAEFRNQTISKIADAAASHFQPRSSADEASAAPLIRPLLNQLLQSEWRLEITGKPNAPVYLLGVPLNPATREVWEKNLSELFTKFRLKNKPADCRLSTSTHEDWLIFGIAPGSDAANSVALAKSVVERFVDAAKTSEATPWLRIDAQLSQLRRLLFENRGPGIVDKLELNVTPRGENLRTEMRVSLSKSHPLKIDRWNIPTNSIADPEGTLMRFTAVQGLSAVKPWQNFFNHMEIDKAPNQLFVWSQAYGPFAGQIQAAAHVGNPANFIDRFATHWVPSLNSNITKNAVGQLAILTNRVIWKGLPIVVPTLDPAPDTGFVVASLLPLPQSTNRAPAELFEQITGRTNLVYYDWEVTQVRLGQIRALMQLGSLLTTFRGFGTDSAASKWLDAIAPQLGNTVTEAAAVSPKELAITRTSPIGLTSLELVGLMHWLESTDFPQFKFDLRFRPPQIPGR